MNNEIKDRTGQRVGQAYASKRSAQTYAERNWTGPKVEDRDCWHIEVRKDDDGWWCYITHKCDA